MTTPLNWREADEVRLTGKFVQNPNNTKNHEDYLANVRIAIDGAFVHIDARRTNEPAQLNQTEFTIHIVPAAAVEVIRYKEQIEADYDITASIF